MATTAIWDVTNRLDKVLKYAENPNKTENLEYSNSDVQGLRDVMAYTTQDYKTEKQFYVTGINCITDTAREEMILTKKQFSKEGGIIAYHAYQSFAPGEANPEIAHEIGIKLAKDLWGDRFELIVATHLDKGHLHNHFVINSVSFMDGKRYYDNKATYTLLRKASDRLCKEYGLSIVENPKHGQSKHYAEWKAEQNGKPTWRSIIRKDVDNAVKRSMTMTQFLKTLRDMGYEVKTGVKYMAVRPQGKERFFRLYKLGEHYTEVAIKQRILRQSIPERPPKPSSPVFVKGKYKGSFTLYKITWKGLHALYLHYIYLLRKAQRSYGEDTPFILREDLRQSDVIVSQAKFLSKYKINTADELAVYKSSVESRIGDLTSERKTISNEKRRKTVTAIRITEISERISTISKELKQCRHELKRCDDILIRSVLIKEKLEHISQNNIKEKELNEHEPGSRRGRPNRKHGTQRR